MLSQLKNDRHSIINNGEIHNQRQNIKQAIQFASMDKDGILPEQVWYDSLRASDNGYYSRTTNNSPKNDRYQLQGSGKKSPLIDYLKEKVTCESNKAKQ